MPRDRHVGLRPPRDDTSPRVIASERGNLRKTKAKNIKPLDIMRIYAYNSNNKGVKRMKRNDLIRLFERNGWIFEREGGNHTVYTNGKKSEAIPRHNEINERLAKALIKKHNLK